MQGMVPSVDIAVVHHRTPERLRETLVALARYAPELRVVVVDTAFDQAVAEGLTDVHPQVRWEQTVNHSYAHAFNVAIQVTEAPLVVVMNADVVVGPQTLSALEQAIAEPQVAASGPLLTTATGHLQPMGVGYRLLTSRLQLRARWRRQPASSGSTLATSIEASWLSGALLMVKREAIHQAGGMDPRFRFYNEDLEWGLRLRRAGWRLRLVATEALHYGGAATPSDPRFLLEGWRGGLEISRRFYPSWLQHPQRIALSLAAQAMAWRERDPAKRQRFLEAAERLRHGSFDRPLFGPTLDSDPTETGPLLASER